MRSVAIIPAHNEAESIQAIIDEADSYVSEVVVVDDASTDETAAIARNQGAAVIEHTLNTGVGGALRTGYRYAIRGNYDLVVQIDGDGQHDPSYIPQLLETAENCNMVIGSRYLNQSHKDYSLIRRLGIQFFTKVINKIGNVSTSDVTSGFRAYWVEDLEHIIHRSDKHWAIEQTLDAAKNDFNIKEISVEMPVRENGNSHFTIGILLAYPIRMIDTILRVVIFR